MTQTEEDRKEILRLAYEQGIRGLDSQESTLNGIRQTGAAIAAINGLCAAFLGRHVLEDAKALLEIRCLGIGLFELLAILGLAGSVLSVVQLFRPRDGWIFHFEPSKVVNQFAHGPKATTLSKTYEVLAGFAEENYNTNEKHLHLLFRWLAISIVFFLLHLGGWLVGLAHEGAP